MYELYPYFTNDGTVGLFSRTEDDIYHSSSGAVTESWEKFILPSHLKSFIENNDSIKILDICFGIGYNTKAALKVFYDNFYKNKKKSKNLNTNSQKFSKKSCIVQSSIAQIDTDNILSNKNSTSENEIEKQIEILEKSYNKAPTYNEEIYADNIDKQNYKNLLIDAVDMDKILIQLAPFIKERKKNRILYNDKIPKEKLTERELDKFSQIKRIRNKGEKKLKSEYKLNKAIEIILLVNLLKNNSQNFEVLNDEEIIKILSDKSYSPFFSKYMINFAKFYQNNGYKYKSDADKLTFLHNIYYRYLSKSYKKASEIIDNSKIDINFNNIDARDFVRASEQTYNFIFLDAFTPAKCPSLWTKQFFNSLYQILDNNGMLLTYSNSAAVRNAMLQNDFYVGKIYIPEINKFMGTVATKNPDLIEHKLSEIEIGLINSKAGICYEDENLDLSNSIILKNRTEKVKHSSLISSAKYLRGFKK